MLLYFYKFFGLLFFLVRTFIMVDKNVVVQDTVEQIRIFNESRLGRVLVEEGLANDVKFAINNLRKREGFGVTDRVGVELVCGSVLASSIYWNREMIMREALVNRLFINGVDMTVNSSLHLVSDPIDYDPAMFTVFDCGAADNRFKLALRILAQ